MLFGYGLCLCFFFIEQVRQSINVIGIRREGKKKEKEWKCEGKEKDMRDSDVN